MEGILIKKVKEHDVLYNTESTYYRDTKVRQQTWEKIGKELNLKAIEAKSAWDKLRRCFINARNRRRIKEHETGITIHPWKYEKDMAFILPFVGKNCRTLDYLKYDDSTTSENGDSDSEDVGRGIADNIKTEAHGILEDNMPDTSMLYYGNEEMPTPMVDAVIENKRKHPLDEDIAERMDYKERCMFQKNPLSEMDESDLFFMSMSKMTKTLPALERAKVKLAVSNAVLQSIISVHGNTSPS